MLKALLTIANIYQCLPTSYLPHYLQVVNGVCIGSHTVRAMVFDWIAEDIYALAVADGNLQLLRVPMTHNNAFSVLHSSEVTVRERDTLLMTMNPFNGYVPVLLS